MGKEEGERKGGDKTLRFFFQGTRLCDEARHGKMLLLHADLNKAGR